MPVTLSKTSKLDGIKSWSLQARDTCPGSIDNGELVPACQGCYATTGNYRFDNVKAPREANKLDWQRLDWADDMVKALDDSRYFRWFDSGDMYSVALAEKILEVMQRTPWCNHWLPTRMHKFPKFRLVIESMQSLPNVMVRPSSDSVLGEFLPGTHGSTIVPSPESLPKGVKLCQAYEKGGKCSGCRACWSKDVPVIAYPAHGVRMAKVIRLAIAA
jgi:hypothetical protein